MTQTPRWLGGDRTPVPHLPTLLVLLLAVLTGCAGPWARTSRIPLPSSQANPEEHVPTANATDATPKPAGEAQDASAEQLIIRGQSVDGVISADDEDVFRDAMPVTDAAASSSYDPAVRLAQYDQTPPGSPFSDYGSSSGFDPGYAAPGSSYSPPAPFTGGGYAPSGGPLAPDGGPLGPANDGTPNVYTPGGVIEPLPSDYADLVVNLRETQTGRFMFGVGVNSDLGLTAQAIIDERNFDWRRWPRSLDEIINGTAWRGGGQSLRIEAVPGTEVQRYMVNFTQPFLFDTPISFNVSGYLFDRRYFDWDEQRIGGRIGLGYRITPDLSLGASLRAEQVDFHDPRVRGIPIIERVLGESDVFSGKVTLTHDTRDLPFAATEGHYLELSYEQVFGSFDYPRGGIDYRRYFLLRQRADGSGRHTISFSFRGGITGSQTPVFENFFAGGYSTMRGFRFRHASPKIFDVIVGGQLSLLGSAEYIFPITADDMLKGALFCDYGTVEESYNDIDIDDFRVAVGAGIRVNVPAMGPAPIAIDFAIPLAREGSDRIQNFSFFMGFGR